MTGLPIETAASDTNRLFSSLSAAIAGALGNGSTKLTPDV